ncbi:dihydroxyacetone kinase subunit DhaL [Companilactobacillus sp. RD055328]|uniref:dihydroxyacetone kinase subunit DhaL n=1 Tax=Companilactobacillus sp. RD055328 TaxID=2916634 RepID=UPI001FC86BAB|nr:dihydroxyacetone kinase subunit DhaL [Companilactobacillus sp. RD055328]
MKQYQEQISKNKHMLSELDDAIGDGDHGNNMDRGMTEVVKTLEEKNPSTITESFKIIAMTLLSKVGGASGPLYGTAFLEMSKASKEDAELASLIEAGAQGIAKRGGATAGDKTMLDVWLPVASELKQKSLTSQKLEDFMNLTKDMQAKKGRASYLGERSIGFVDPGAASSKMLFETLLSAIK